MRMDTLHGLAVRRGREPHLMGMRDLLAVALRLSAGAVVTSFWSYALGTDVTFRLVDQNRVPVPASVFVVEGIPVAQDHIVTLGEGTRTVTVFPGNVGGTEDTALYCMATLKISGATQLIELVWRTSSTLAKEPRSPGRSAGDDHAGEAHVPECALVTKGHFTLTFAENGDWTYHPGRPMTATVGSSGDPAIVELAGQIAGITSILASPGAFYSSPRPRWQGAHETGEDWVISGLEPVAAEAQVFFERARLLKRNDPELQARLVSLQDRVRQASLSMSAPDGFAADLIARRLSAVERLLEQMETLLAPP
jgi:hypothetical protein